jgi:NTP pyrophosphatase (non-canonical NTP hydrolase)
MNEQLRKLFAVTRDDIRNHRTVSATAHLDELEAVALAKQEAPAAWAAGDPGCGCDEFPECTHALYFYMGTKYAETLNHAHPTTIRNAAIEAAAQAIEQLRDSKWSREGVESDQIMWLEGEYYATAVRRMKDVSVHNQTYMDSAIAQRQQVTFPNAGGVIVEQEAPADALLLDSLKVSEKKWERDGLIPPAAALTRAEELIAAIVAVGQDFLHETDFTKKSIDYTTLRAHCLVLREDYDSEWPATSKAAPPAMKGEPADEALPTEEPTFLDALKWLMQQGNIYGAYGESATGVGIAELMIEELKLPHKVSIIRAAAPLDQGKGEPATTKHESSGFACKNCGLVQSAWKSHPRCHAAPPAMKGEPAALTFQRFSEINRQRCESPEGFNHALSSWSTSDWFTAVFGELGEAANVAKKLNRIRDSVRLNANKGATAKELQEKLRQELGDGFVYLDLLAQSLGFLISEAAVEVFNAKSEELGCPIVLAAATANHVAPVKITNDPIWRDGSYWTCAHGNKSSLHHIELECGCRLVMLAAAPLEKDAGKEA